MAVIPRFLSVRERVLRAVQNALLDIQQNSGYNTNVRKVERIRTIPTQHTSPPQIYLMPDQSHVLWRGSHNKFERIPVDIWFAAQAPNAEDTEFNYLLGDIQNRLGCGMLVDNTHPQSNWAQIYITEEFAQPLYNSYQNGIMLGVSRFTFEFWRSWNDSRLWDIGDQLVLDTSNG